MPRGLIAASAGEHCNSSLRPVLGASGFRWQALYARLLLIWLGALYNQSAACVRGLQQHHGKRQFSTGVSRWSGKGDSSAGFARDCVCMNFSTVSLWQFVRAAWALPKPKAAPLVLLQSALLLLTQNLIYIEDSCCKIARFVAMHSPLNCILLLKLKVFACSHLVLGRPPDSCGAHSHATSEERLPGSVSLLLLPQRILQCWAEEKAQNVANAQSAALSSLSVVLLFSASPPATAVIWCWRMTQATQGCRSWIGGLWSLSSGGRASLQRGSPAPLASRWVSATCFSRAVCLNMTC